ncbi:MAG: hypothetical protein RR277_09305, partial [Rikenellaceae bacterium]
PELVLGLSSATILNAPSHGLVMAQGEIHKNTKYAYYVKKNLTSLKDAVEFKPALPSGGVTTIGPFTVFEADNVSVLLACKVGIEGTTTYHRLAICDESKKSISLVTNVHYILNITDITGPGYATPELARDNVPTNQVKYDVLIDDGSHSVSNGESYLSFTSQEFLLCQRTGGCSDINIGKLTYNGPSAIGAARLDFNANSSKWIMKTIGSLDNPHGAKKSKDLTLTYGNTGDNVGDFTNVEGSNVTFIATYGVLKLETKLSGVQGSMNPWFGDLYPLGTGFKQIALDEESDWAWLTYAPIPNTLPMYPPRIVGEVDSTKTIYLVTKPRTSLRQVNFTGVRGNNVVRGRCIQP